MDFDNIWEDHIASGDVFKKFFAVLLITAGRLSGGRSDDPGFNKQD